jgi:tetratricopeptide (TPR) repeat protein
MISKRILIAILLLGGAISASAQTPTATPAVKKSDMLAAIADAAGQNAEIPRERREQAYAKLLEGQRYLLQSSPTRGSFSAANARSAKAAFQRSVELDPTLAEGYTALAELELSTPPTDVDEAINLAKIAVKVEPDNYGGHRILARLYTYRSKLRNGTLDPEYAGKAIAEWKEMTRLDPRNAEAWAFLAEFYSETGKTDEELRSLQRWVASATPLETSFYRQIMGRNEALTPENASLKLAAAYIKSDRAADAISVLSELISDDPDSDDALSLLREAVEDATPDNSEKAVSALQQAVYANPGNSALVTLLAQVQARTGKIGDASKLLTSTSAKLESTDKEAAAALQISLGDVYASTDQTDNAILAYEKALSVRGVKENATVADRDREFVMGVFEKMIQTYKTANRPNDVKAVILRARKMLGQNDLFADRQLIMFYRESGQKEEALRAVQAARLRSPFDYGFLRLEASLLTELGQVDKAVGMIRGLSIYKRTPAPGIKNPNGNSTTVTAAPPIYDEFSNELFISQLYTQANRTKDAIAAATQAYLLAKDLQRKQIARLTLATAQQTGGDYAGAETTLREILQQTPGNPIALNNLGYFLLERDERVDEAITMIEQAVRIDPTNPSYLDSLGWGYFKKGNLAAAERKLKDAARLDPGSSTIQEHLADVYQKQGKAELARSVLQRALVMATDASDVQRLKAKLAETK